MVGSTREPTTSSEERDQDRPSLGRRLLGDVRTRIVASYVLLLTLTIGSMVVIVREVLLHRVDDRVDANLAQEVNEFRQLTDGTDPETGKPFGADVKRIFRVFLDRNVPNFGEQLITVPATGRALFRASTTAQPGLPRELFSSWRDLTEAERGEVETSAGSLRYLAVPVIRDGETLGAFAVTSLLDGEREEVTDAVQIVATVGAIVLLAGTVFAFVAVGRVVAPLRELRDAARSVSGADMTKRIAVAGDDEIAELGNTFNRMLDRLELAFATQRGFIRDAGHELRTPIAVVRGHLELMAEEDEADPARRETLEMLAGELDRMTRFVNDMLLLAKAERPDFLKLETVALGSLCEELVIKSEALGDRTFRLDATTDATIVADRQRITQAIMNLVGNSVSSTTKGQEIAIGCRTSGSQAMLWVRDSGRGIDPTEREELLKPFRRGRGTRYEGTGLGLALVNAIAMAHEGAVDIDGELGVGSTVTLKLPVEGPTEEEAS